MDNVSFCGAKVFANPSMYIKNAKASEIAEAINIGVKQAGKDLGVKIKHPHLEGKMSGELLKKINPDSFDKATQKLTDSGKKGFDHVYGSQFGVTVESKLKDLIQCARKVATQSADETGLISYGFKYMA